jgi:hypothetical protein
MSQLLNNARDIHPTGFHRGIMSAVVGLSTGPTGAYEYAEVSLERMLSECHHFNEELRRTILADIKDRVREGLARREADFLPIPVFFEPVCGPPNLGRGETEDRKDANRTAARTVDCVNMQIVNGHLFVPKPHGPRVSAGAARQILLRTISQLHLDHAVQPRVDEVDGFWFWCRPGISMDFVAAAFANVPNRPELVTWLHASSQAETPTPEMEARLQQLARTDRSVARYLRARHPSAEIRQAVEARKRDLLDHDRNRHLPLDHDGRFTGWRRLWVPENTVDLIESFILSVLEPLGQRVHFIDDWEYHEIGGEVHCGTNTLRRMPSTKWWKSYDPSLNLRYTIEES